MNSPQLIATSHQSVLDSHFKSPVLNSPFHIIGTVNPVQFSSSPIFGVLELFEVFFVQWHLYTTSSSNLVKSTVGSNAHRLWRVPLYIRTKRALELRRPGHLLQFLLSCFCPWLLCTLELLREGMRCDALLFLSTLGDFAQTNRQRNCWVRLTFLYVCVGVLLGFLCFVVPWLLCAGKLWHEGGI